MSNNKCPPYKVTFSGSDKYGKQRLELAIHLREVLNKLKLNWYVENGTLLGAFRNGKFIKHDDDFDIALLYQEDPLENLKKDLKLIQANINPTFKARLVETYTKKIEVFNPSFGKYALIGDRYDGADFHHVTVDLQSYYYQNDYYVSTYNYNKLKNHQDDIFPLTKILFEGEYFPAPVNTIKILENEYGSIDENATFNPLTKKYELS
jgi:phosphorylcholine metabolism protein LicD